ncbi:MULTISPECIES: chemotaxis protein CheW [unclassified Helicobacter]|uniref:chemotaxis protein CheW n=1 Tax=unclassified Helicobacter TaxID=2593540 RepID=UPI000CF14395|nr:MULTISPECIES: chemotaxis protein CheW [unclassified Helicobacter]
MINELQEMPHTRNEAQFLCFLLDDASDAQIYAINVFKIREVISHKGDFTRTIDGDNGIVLGTLLVRDEVIPLIDVKRWLHFNPRVVDRNLSEYTLEDEKSLVIICDFSRCTIGLQVMQVKHIIQRSWEKIQAGVDHGLKEDSKIIATTRYEDDSLVQILDIERMLQEAFPVISDKSNLDLDSLGEIKSNQVVLIAEDSRSALKSLEAVIKKLGLKYLSFPDGKELLMYLEHLDDIGNIGAIVTDLEMPNLSGFELLKQIKASDKIRHLPVLINSSMQNEANFETAMKFGADGFVVKTQPKEIEKNLRKILIKE